MTLTSGSRLGPYEILSALGAGGMGEVYRARDAKLNRDVAIKLLPELFASDPDRVARFQREAQLLAALNHPHIGAIYGFEETVPAAGSGQTGVRALVLELVEGPTLADRIAQGPLHLGEALAIAKQIAAALESAHEKGIIHRDLKPANVKVTPDGVVKVLDFGLAKILETEASASSISMSPTLSVHATYAGVILGTASYMSPEQARGRPVDTRTDLWAFGCIVYEMLTGRKTFEAGETVSDAVAAVLRADVDWSALPAETPSNVRRLLRRCLEKDRTRRLNSAAAARLEIEDVHGEPDRAATAIATPIVAPTRERLVWTSALVAVALAAVAATVFGMRTGPGAVLPETRLEISTPGTPDPVSFALSPDGTRIVFVASAASGQAQLWMRPLGAVTAQPLAGTDDASYPFWSPDSKSVGFFAADKLKRLDLGGGLPQILATAVTGRGGTWSEAGVILFSNSLGPLLRITASGGDPTAVTKLIGGDGNPRFPSFLPGGRRFLFFVSGAGDSTGIFEGSLDSPDVSRLTAATSGGAYLPPGWLLYSRQGTLVARRFDVARTTLTGDPVTVADLLSTNPGATGSVALSVSTTGLVAYRTSGSGSTQLTWFDRSGRMLTTIGSRDEGSLLDPELSPDGLRIAAARTVDGNSDIWLFDGARKTRFTFDPAPEQYPLWSPDGTRIVFSRNTKGAYNLYTKSSSGAGSEALLLETDANKAPTSWSADGRFLLFSHRSPSSAGDVGVFPFQGEGKPYPLLNTTFQERYAVFSPDARWFAYQSDESGRYEIYARPFNGSTGGSGPPANPGGPVQLSTAGGITPRWSADGKELYYIAPDAKMMAVTVVFKDGAIEPGTPRALFQTRILYGGTSPVGPGRQFDVSRDGRFLINVSAEESVSPPIIVMQNWAPKN